MEIVLNNFVEACREGNLELVKELTKTHNLTAEDARLNENMGFQFACALGHISVAQWLVETFGLTTEDARSKNNYAFRWACYNSFISVAQWLLDNFLTVEDALEVGKDPFLSSKMKDWLINYQTIGTFTKPAKM
jgi:hypothetical protein